ncbi:pyridoxamine 5'-phosphate oxidase family protein [Microlunatus sp. Gsoil 973]|jgi:general stress protein 26|uniref:pyridoxamine 5'-phosphate oxidase family protein n=1 Tax=Microlunatus sp. Gsoil 973 TaxID=2672569 RepID=UPI0012B45E21|nr:pyridoxamine 5'-phosphate oxidase family protein [Microlunatus sp. Gsoil 973]QGN33258.1 general stress protein [Microlunatus sp. Gsoil 973]
MSDQNENLTPDERAEADRQAVAEVIENARIAVVTTIEADGSLVSRPLALQQRRFDGDLYFFTPDPTDKTEQVRNNPATNVAIESRGNYLSIAGSASITKDPALIDELWNTAAEAWFESGRDDPAVALLKVHAESAELQAIDTPRPIAAVKYLKAAVTGTQPDVGDATRVEM